MPQDEQRDNSFWEVTCECGKQIHTKTLTVQCPKCGRLLVIEGWGKKPAERIG